MKKNEIIEKIIVELLEQRSALNCDLGQLNHNESNFFENRITLENAISNIDAHIDRRVQDCELSPL